MTRSEVLRWLKTQNIDARAISLAVPTDDNGDVCDDNHPDACTDATFGRCDISGEEGNIYRCMAGTKNGETVEFDAGDWLIGGHLGSIAGAF